MTDCGLRDLERRWQATGAVEDEARLLLERVRVGVLQRPCLELGAYLEHPAALAALGLEEEPLADAEERILWLRGLSFWGVEALCRGLVAWLLSAAGEREAWSQEFAATVGAVDEWWADPTAASAQLVDDRRLATLDAHRPRAELAGNLSLSVCAMHEKVPEGRGESYRLLNLIHQFAGHSPPPSPADLRERLWGWALTAQEDSLVTQRELEPSSSLRRQVVDATTPPVRRQVVGRLRDALNRPVVLVREDGKRREATILACEYESFLAFYGNSPLCRTPLEGYVDVERI